MITDVESPHVINFPENIALLAGDALNTLAFEVIANSAMNGVISADKAVMLISVLARAVALTA